MSSRKEQKERLKAERLEKERQRQAAERRKRIMGFGAAGILALAAVGAIVAVIALGGGDGDDSGSGGDEGALVSFSDNPPALPEPTGDQDIEQLARAAKCDLANPENEGREHTEGSVNYRANPPTSGPHHPVWTQDGAYDRDPGTTGNVHALEHGRVVLQVQPTAPQPVIDQMKALFDEDTYHMLLVPNMTGMPGLVAATAWDRSLVCEEMSDDAVQAMRAFRDQFRDQGPENVP